jgi:[ribosomal protein S5]-alanine N-acetyltransferase
VSPIPTLELQVPGCQLRPWRSTDAQAMVDAINHPITARNMADWFPETGYTVEMAREWVNGGAQAFGGSNWAVDHFGVAIGGCGVHPGEGFARCNAEIGYWLAAAHWGKGVGADIVRALTEHAFANPQVTRVFAPIHADNFGSQRVCEKNGFTNEGLRRMSVMKWGRAIDTVVWAKYRDNAAA